MIVVPAVSVVIVVAPQPEEVETVDCASVTVHVTLTLLVYQPLLPRVPVTFDVITGGVLSTLMTESVAVVAALSSRLSLLAAVTVRVCEPVGVEPSVAMVSVPDLALSPGVRLIGRADAVDPGGNPATKMFALKAPGDPGPDPRFTVTV